MDVRELNYIESLLRVRQAAAAEKLARELTEHCDTAEAHILLGRALQQQGRIEAALQAADAARRCVPEHPGATLLAIECLLQTEEFDRGLEELRSLELKALDHARLLQDVGNLYSHLNLHRDAERCYGRVASLAPGDPRALYNWATCLTALGDLESAERILDRVIALAPEDHDAYYNRSTLRRQRTDHNHVAELQGALSTTSSPTARVALGYALAKELEDLRRWPESFAALRAAADTRHRFLSYRVEHDVATMTQIAEAFDAEYCRAGRQAGFQSRRPIFIVGLPRSGTTLVDRILSSHTRVASRGESSDLAHNLMRLAGPTTDKTTLIKRATRLDPTELGRRFCARLPHADVPRVIDKTPLNFLYLGLIAAALPQATLIHVRRQPLDVCYAMYKTLFRMAYPFSYDLSDLASYYAAYAALMQHWRDTLGPRLVEIDYEVLVADQEQTTRGLLQACDLPWEDACLEFHRNESPSLTASAAQVRQPLYHSSVGSWRRYERELQPLIHALNAHDIALDRAPEATAAAPT